MLEMHDNVGGCAKIERYDDHSADIFNHHPLTTHKCTRLRTVLVQNNIIFSAPLTLNEVSTIFIRDFFSERKKNCNLLHTHCTHHKHSGFFLSDAMPAVFQARHFRFCVHNP
jgi:hypothetical protein